MTKINFDENELLLLAAAINISVICSATPSVFDTLQLSKISDEYVRSYAKACVVILNDHNKWIAFVDKLSKASVK